MNNSLLPPNASAAERAMEAATARVSDVPVLVRQSWDPDACPAELLPWLADAFSVDTWDPEWSEAQKRQTIKDSVFVHRHKGTIGAVRSALAALGIGVQVQEWFRQRPEGQPYTFRLLLSADQVGISEAVMRRVQAVVDATKNLRSHLGDIALTIDATAGPSVSVVAVVGSEITNTGFDYSLVADGSVNGDGVYRANGFKIPL